MPLASTVARRTGRGCRSRRPGRPGCGRSRSHGRAPARWRRARPRARRPADRVPLLGVRRLGVIDPPSGPTDARSARVEGAVSSCYGGENPRRRGSETPRRAAAVVILAAGSGEPASGPRTNKVLLPLRRRPRAGVVGRATRSRSPAVRRPVVVVPGGGRDAVGEALAPHLAPDDGRRSLVVGAARPGTTRSGTRCARSPRDRVRRESTWSRSTTAPGRWPAPPCSTRPSRAAREPGGAIPVVPLHGLLSPDGRPRRARAGTGCRPRRRSAPPSCSTAYARAERDGFTGTDTAACFASRTPTCPIVAVPGPRRNLKITFPEDLALAERLLELASAVSRLQHPRSSLGAPPRRDRRRRGPRPAVTGVTGPAARSPGRTRSAPGRQVGRAAALRPATARQHDRGGHRDQAGRGRRSRRPDVVRRPRFTVSVTGRTPTTTGARSTAAATQSAMNAGGVIGHSESWRTRRRLGLATAVQGVRESRGCTPASPSAQDGTGDQRLAVQQRERQRAAALVEHPADRRGVDVVLHRLSLHEAHAKHEAPR